VNRYFQIPHTFILKFIVDFFGQIQNMGYPHSHNNGSALGVVAVAKPNLVRDNFIWNSPFRIYHLVQPRMVILPDVRVPIHKSLGTFPKNIVFTVPLSTQGVIYFQGNKKSLYFALSRNLVHNFFFIFFVPRVISVQLFQLSRTHRKTFSHCSPVLELFLIWKWALDLETVPLVRHSGYWEKSVRAFTGIVLFGRR